MVRPDGVRDKKWRGKTYKDPSIKPTLDNFVERMGESFAGYILLRGCVEILEPSLQEKMKIMRPDLQEGTAAYNNTYNMCLNAMGGDAMELACIVNLLPNAVPDFNFRGIFKDLIEQLQIPAA